MSPSSLKEQHSQEAAASRSGEDEVVPSMQGDLLIAVFYSTFPSHLRMVLPPC